MKISGGGFTLELEDETLEDRRKSIRRKDDLERTIQENVAGLRLEDTPCIIGDCGIINPDGMEDSDQLKEQYEAFLTDPRRI